jgi:uncharacterized protein (TIGR02466 family)
MNIELFPIFSTPIYKTNIFENVNAEEILRCIKKEFFSLLHEKNGYKSDNSYVLEKTELKDLKNIIQHNINFFAYDLLGVDKNIEFYITNSWLMKHKSGQWAQRHTHANSLLSGIFYLQVNENTGSLLFEKGLSHIGIFPSIFDIPFQKDTQFNFTKFSIRPNNNDLILFPSHLPHSVEVNNSNEDRYCLSFNVFVKGNLGNNCGINYLQLR